MIDIQKILEKLGLIVADNSEVRFQAINIVVPNGSPVGSAVENSAVLDKKYNRIIGIGYNNLTTPDIGTNFLVGAKSNRQTWVDDIASNAWSSGNAGPMQKFLRTNISYGSGDTFTGRITPRAATAGFTGQIVLLLQVSLTELPR